MLVGVAGAHAEALSAQGSCGAAQGHFLVFTSLSCAHCETKGVPLHATENVARKQSWKPTKKLLKPSSCSHNPVAMQTQASSQGTVTETTAADCSTWKMMLCWVRCDPDGKVSEPFQCGGLVSWALQATGSPGDTEDNLSVDPQDVVSQHSETQMEPPASAPNIAIVQAACGPQFTVVCCATRVGC